MIKQTLFLMITLFLNQTVLATGSNESLPMYGGMDRAADPELSKQDYLFIAGATKTFGTREHASTGYVDSGFDFFLEKKYDRAMVRFNEAWLLDPDNPYVYLGFGSVLKSKQQYCEAMKMFDYASSKGLDEPRFLADHALTINQCAVFDQANASASHGTMANSLYEQAVLTPNPKHRAYVYQSWARSALLNRNIERAGNMVKEAQKLGANIDPTLLDDISNAANQL